MCRCYLSVPTKLWALMCMLIAVSLGKAVVLSCFLTLLCFLQFIVQGKLKVLLSYGLFYVVLGILLYGIRYHGFHLAIFSEFYVLMFWNLSPIILISWDLITTSPGELSSFLSRIHTPTPIILGMLVTFRFLPTMKSELKTVSLSMKNRGLTALKNVLLHPVTTCEYVLIPFLFRILMIADQLSVSAVARGAESPGYRGSYYRRNIGILDFATAILWTASTVIYLKIGGIKV